MIPKECKRLAEVDFPIAVVSRHSAMEKAIRHGHPSTLHLWWARRPLAACRAMLMALLLPDPCDPNCPEEFKQRARNILPRVQGRTGANDHDLRNELLRFIGDLANWGNAANAVFLEAARGLVKAAHGNEAPLTTDPFAGGGSIPLEALRLGCDAFASDLNPVACSILKAILDDIPRHGSRLLDDLSRVGTEIKEAAEKEIGHFYPPDPDGSRPMAYVWARTVTCDSCGAEIPLMRSWWLSRKATRKRALRCRVIRATGQTPLIEFEVFEPKADTDVAGGTVTRAKATCLACRVVLPPSRVRVQLASQRGGADVLFDSKGHRIGGALLLAVVVLRKKSIGRQYRVASDRDYELVWKAQQRVQEMLGEKLSSGLSVIPDEPTPIGGGSGAGRAFSVHKYGMINFGDLFTARQKLALTSLCAAARTKVSSCSSQMLALLVSKHSELMSANCPWEPVAECPRKTFNMQALPMRWEFAESVITSESSGGISTTLENILANLRTIGSDWRVGDFEVGDARVSRLPHGSADVWFTDPPYYDAVPYSDLSDFFFVWLKRTMVNSRLTSDPFDAANPLTPKEREIVQDETKDWEGLPKDSRFFEAAMALTFRCGRLVLTDEGVGCVVFAHKTTEGWEALLSALIREGWVVVASWPIQTEQVNRPRARESAALATSVHLVCRPRPENAGVGDWGDVLRELPDRVGSWIERLQTEGVKGADLVFACIGPAIEIYSRYSRVEDAEGREIPLGGDPTAVEPHVRGFLAYVWETVGRLALEEVLGTAEARARNGGAGALEEDSRLTALFLWTLQTTETESTNGASSDAPSESEEADEEDDDGVPKKKKAGYSLIYDVARRFAQPLGIHLDKWEGRVIETEKGIVRLIPVLERASQLFGEADAAAISRRIEADVKASRNYTLGFMQDVGAAPEIKTRTRGRTTAASSGSVAIEAPAPQQATTLDRLHAAMLLQRGGQTNGLRAMLREETQRGPDFLRLANALSRLYPKDSEEKRLLDAMLLAVPRS